MFVNTKDLLHQAKAASARGPCCVVPWDAWGPDRTRLILGKFYSRPCSNRSVVFRKRPDHSGLLQLLDFNPFTMSPNISPPPNMSIRLIEDESIVERGDIFESDIHTSLAYSEISMEVDNFFDNHVNLYLSNEIIVVVSV
jgi:hypothetical protein